MNQPSRKSEKIVIEASDKNTSAERLQEIYENYQPKKIKRAIASNPNTPLDIVISLSQHFPASFLENPLLNEQSLNDIDFLSRIPKEALINIIKLPETPQKLILFALNTYPQTDILTIIIEHHNQLWNEWIKNNGNLSNANLSEANLSGISFIHGNLSGANLNNSNLSSAYLIQAKLNGANLSDANLSDSYLNNAFLVNAKLINSNLNKAKLNGADLRNADLRNADLRNADLEEANFRDANLKGAKFKGANLKDVKINSGTKIDNPKIFQ